MQFLKLNETDARIYLDLLNYGLSAASSIGARTHIDRTTAYAALKRLINRGFVTRAAKKGTTVFSALEPTVLEGSLMKDIDEQRHKLASLQQLIPELSLMREQRTARPAVQIFEGVEGVISLYELMLRTSKEQSAFLTVERLPKEMREYLTKTYIRQKRRYKVQSRVIVSDSAHAKRYQSLDHKANRQTKIIPKSFLPFETEIIIGKDEIAVIDLSQSFFGVLVRSSPVRNTLKAIFEMQWAMLG